MDDDDTTWLADFPAGKCHPWVWVPTSMQNFRSRRRSLSRSSRTLARIAADTRSPPSASLPLRNPPELDTSSGMATRIFYPSLRSRFFSSARLRTVALTSAGRASILCATKQLGLFLKRLIDKLRSFCRFRF